MTLVAYLVSGTGLDVDVEAALVAVYKADLSASFPGLVVAASVPKGGHGGEDFPDLLVVPTRVGGSVMSPRHDRPMVSTQCWASDTTAAWELAGAARVVARGLSDRRVVLPGLGGGPAEPVWVSWYRQTGGPASFPDPRTTHVRYQFTDMFTVIR